MISLLMIFCENLKKAEARSHGSEDQLFSLIFDIQKPLKLFRQVFNPLLQ